MPGERGAERQTSPDSPGLNSFEKKPPRKPQFYSVMPANAGIHVSPGNLFVYCFARGFASCSFFIAEEVLRTHFPSLHDRIYRAPQPPRVDPVLQRDDGGEGGGCWSFDGAFLLFSKNRHEELFSRVMTP